VNKELEYTKILMGLAAEFQLCISVDPDGGVSFWPSTPPMESSDPDRPRNLDELNTAVEKFAAVVGTEVGELTARLDRVEDAIRQNADEIEEARKEWERDEGSPPWRSWSDCETGLDRETR